MTHDERCANAKKAIDAVFADTSVDAGTSEDSLLDLKSHIDILLDSLDSMTDDEE